MVGLLSVARRRSPATRTYRLIEQHTRCRTALFVLFDVAALIERRDGCAPALAIRGMPSGEHENYPERVSEPLTGQPQPRTIEQRIRLPAIDVEQVGSIFFKRPDAFT